MEETWLAELRSAELRRGAAGEFTASLLLVWITLGTVIYSSDDGIGVENQTQISLCVGACVSVLIFIFAGVSGAHFNSCFSFAVALSGRSSWLRAAVYSAAQVAGMATGAALVAAGSPALFAKAGGGANLVQPGFSAGAALCVEVFITCYVFLLCFAIMDAERRPPAAAAAIGPLVAGMAVTSALYVGIPVSSGCLNSSRALAVALVSGNGWRDLWVFIVGPYAGAALCVALYCGVFASPGWHAAWLQHLRQGCGCGRR
jgi:glycerol uptake facilitator-like aquaporin